MVSNRRNRQRRPARAAPRAPKRRLLVVCEGKVTEPEYLRGLERATRDALLEVSIDPASGDPRHLVETAKHRASQANAAAKREKDEFLRFDEVWCVCDVDQHPRLNDARQMARDNGIEMAVSNPCFELWLVLHFRDNPGAQERHAMQRLLRQFLPSYEKHLSFEAVAFGLDAASARARKLDELADADGDNGRNPTTGVYRLADSMRGRLASARNGGRP